MGKVTPLQIKSTKLHPTHQRIQIQIQRTYSTHEYQQLQNIQNLVLQTTKIITKEAYLKGK